MSQTFQCPACGADSDGVIVDHLGYGLCACAACGSWHWNQSESTNYDDVYKSKEYINDQIRDLENMADLVRAYRRHPTYASFFKKVAMPRAGARLLDVGCGVGRFLHAAQAAGWLVAGTDISADAIAIGRRFAKFSLSTDSFADLAVSGESFDAVTAFEVVEHLPDPAATIGEARKLIRPGGIFFCTVPNRECQTVLTTRRSDWLPPVHLQYFTSTGLQRLLWRAGLTQVRAGYIYGGRWPSPFVGGLRGLRALARHARARLSGHVRPERLGLWAMGIEPGVSPLVERN